MRRKILVSAAAGDIGIGVAHILSGSKFEVELYGIDAAQNAEIENLFHQFSIAPQAIESGYLGWIQDYITLNDIDIFIPTSEAEIKLLSELKIKFIAQAKVLISNELAISISLDKHKCLQFLSLKGVNVPKHGLPGVNDPSVYPVILKPRSGRGSKGVQRIESKESLGFKFGEEFVWQEYLNPDDEEYTCPIFRSALSGETRILVLKRKLFGGVTGSGEVINDPEIMRYLTLISEALELDGVINVQLRLTDKGPLLFEINPRLSSTLVFRHKMGFSDLIWWLSINIGESLGSYVPPYAGTRFNREESDNIYYPNH